MDEFVEKLAGIGIPALVFLIVMSLTGFAGAAAVTTALSMLSGPLGMVGGVVVLSVIGAGASLISKYGYDVIISAVCKKIMEKEHLSKRQMCNKIDEYHITNALKEKIKAKINKA